MPNENVRAPLQTAAYGFNRVLLARLANSAKLP
jgi:hypothetical protein